MGASYTNFYETIKEAQMRLTNTIVLYAGEPYYVLCVTDNADGIFRIYMCPVGDQMAPNNFSDIPYSGSDQYYPAGGKSKAMDDWITAHPGSGVIRKMMNSPKFNKFRPFPLGMCNVGPHCVYVERQPTRRSEQGLTPNMLYSRPINLNPGPYGTDVNTWSDSFYKCVKGLYPSFTEALELLKAPNQIAVGFHRLFAVCKGPVGSSFLVYKDSIVGQLSRSANKDVVLSPESLHVKEITEELGVFNTVLVRK